MPVFGPTRAALAAAAARGADILPSLRLVLTAEALTRAPAAPRTGAERRAGRALRRRAGAGGLPCGVAVLLPGIRPAARCRAPGASAGHRTDVSARSFAQ